MCKTVKIKLHELIMNGLICNKFGWLYKIYDLGQKYLLATVRILWKILIESKNL